MLSTSTGLTKTVYNPAALKAAQKSLLVSTSAVDNNEAQKKKQVSTAIILHSLHGGKTFLHVCVFSMLINKVEVKGICWLPLNFYFQ